MEIKLRSVPDIEHDLHGYPKSVQDILLARGIVHSDDLKDDLSRLSDPAAMLGMPDAVKRLVQALTADEFVLIVGDFDADGATSTALLMKGLSAFGFDRLDYFLPDRSQNCWSRSDSPPT